MYSNAGPLFLGYSDFTRDGVKPVITARDDWEKLPPHKDEDQVRLDVDRSFVYYPKSMPTHSSFNFPSSVVLAAVTECGTK